MSRSTSRNRTTLGVEFLEGRDNPASGYFAYGAAPGGVPLAEVDRPDGTILARFQVFEDSFQGGVRTDVGELDGNPNTVELVATPGAGGGSNVKVFSVDVNSGAVAEYASFFAFEPAYRGGLFVTVGDVNNLGVDQIIVGADLGGGPRVRTFALQNGVPFQVDSPMGNFFAFEPTFTGGVRVAAGELDGNPATGDELVLAAGYLGAPRVQVLRSDGAVLADYLAFAPDYLGGVNVGFDNLAAFRASANGGDFSQLNADLNQVAVPPQSVTQPVGSPFPTTSTPFFNTTGTTFGNSFGTPTFPNSFGVPNVAGFPTTNIAGFTTTNVAGFPTSNIGGIPTTNIGGTIPFPFNPSPTFGFPGISNVGAIPTTSVGGVPNFAGTVNPTAGFVNTGSAFNFGTPGTLVPFPTFANPAFTTNTFTPGFLVL